MSISGEYRAQPDQMRAAAGSITAEVLRAYNLLQSMRAMPVPSFGPVGQAAQAATMALREQLETALETTLERLNTVNLLIADAADTYADLDGRAAKDYTFREGR